jgi:hypothetical protein
VWPERLFPDRDRDRTGRRDGFCCGPLLDRAAAARACNPKLTCGVPPLWQCKLPSVFNGLLKHTVEDVGSRWVDDGTSTFSRIV